MTKKRTVNMKLISWNVNGLRACVGKGFKDAFSKLDADFFCLQETKLQDGQIDIAFDGYESYWNYAEKKGYSGTAVFARRKPLSVSYGLGISEHDSEGRVIMYADTITDSMKRAIGETRRLPPFSVRTVTRLSVCPAASCRAVREMRRRGRVI